MPTEEHESICGVLSQLSGEADLAGFLDATPHLVDIQTVKELAEAVRSAMRVDVRRALHLAEAALLIARKLGTDEALAFSMRAKANVLWPAGECKAAVELFENAAVLFERTNNLQELGRTLSSSLQALALLGEYNRAFAAADRAREIFTSLDESLRVARLDINVANIYHRQNRYAEALAAYERAHVRLLPYRDMEGLGVALHNIAVCLICLDDFAGALETYARVRHFCEQQGMPLLVAQADYNIAFLYYLRGEYAKALELLRTTREACRHNGDRYHVALCDLDRSEIYLELNLVKEAAEMAESSVAQFEQLGMGFECVRALTNLAIARNAQGDSGRALELFAKAKEIADRENNQVWPHIIDLYRAVVLLDRDEITAARDLCLSAAEFFCSARLAGKHVLCLLLLTRAAIRAGQMEKAKHSCEEALCILEKLDLPILQYQAQLLRGQIYEDLGETRHAYEFYQHARISLEALRSGLQRDELKIGLMRNRLEVYDRLIRLCLTRGLDEYSPEEALTYVEAQKSRTLRDLVLRGGPPSSDKPDGGTDFDLQIQKLRSDLNWYYHRIEREQLSQEPIVPDNVDGLRQQANKREHELVRLLLEAPHAESSQTALEDSCTSGLSEVRAALGNEATLLEYFAIRGQLFLAVIQQEKVEFIPLGLSTSVLQRMRLLHFQLSKYRLNHDYVKRFEPALLKAIRNHLHAFYDELIGPAESLLHGRQLVIVPFGPLHSLPFHALFTGHEYLLDKFTISYAPSASIFAHCHREMSDVSGPSLILGVDDPAMPFIRQETECVAAVVPEARVFFGAEATERVLREHGSTSRFIHIAAHGHFRHDNPMFSFVRLADSHLTLHDLYRMKLPADLLTLSGCVTGLNAVVEGDELLGLTRGLLCAGARSLLLSFWDVDDRSTCDFMSEFYRKLQTQRKGDALRSAMLDLRDKYPHPYHWAPFKLIGRSLV